MPVSIGLLGAYEQWGFSSGNGAADITFPITFGTLYSITQGFCNSGSVNNWNWAISSYSVSKFHVIGKGGIGLFWIAVGKAQQWGYNNTDYAASVTFPIAFTKSCYAIAIGPHNRVTGNVVAQNITNSKFSLTAPESGDCAQARWIAIGVQRSGDIVTTAHRFLFLWPTKPNVTL